MMLLSPQPFVIRPRPPAPEPAPGPTPGPTRDRPAPAVTPPIEHVQSLLDAAAYLDPEDDDGWDRLRNDARNAIEVLVAGGLLPRHLTIAPHDPPVLVARTLSAAWKYERRA